MRTRFLILPLSLVFVLFSCKETQDEINPSPIVTAQKTELPANSNKVVKSYYSTWEDLVQLLFDYFENIDIEEFYDMELPEIGALNKLNISDTEGNHIVFSDLPIDEQHMFIHELAMYLTDLQTKKVIQVSDLEAYFEYMESVASDLYGYFDSHSDQFNVIGDILESFRSGLENFAHKDDSPSDDTPSPITKSILDFGPASGSDIPYDIFKDEIAGVVKKGDFCIALPIHRRPMVLMNLTNLLTTEGDMDHRLTGHCGIFVEDFNQDVAADSLITIAASWDGVMYEPISNWCTELYILEIKEFEFIWDPESEEPLTVNRKSYSLQKRNEFIAYAQQYLGTPLIDYTIGSNWLTFKNLMPDYFVCSGLLYWCAYHVYGVDMSVSFLPIVTPSRIVLNPYTEIKRIVE